MKHFSEKFPYATLIFLIGIFAVIFPYIINGNIPGEITDTRFNFYVLEHFYLALSGADSFIDAPFFYPFSKTILLSDNHWGTGLIYAYFRWQNLEPFQAYIGWFLVGFILNYWVSLYIFRKVELSNLAAGIAAFIFTFSLPVISQEIHSQLIARTFIPLAFLSTYHYTKSKDLKYIAITALFISLQFLTSVYNGVFLIYFLLAFITSEILLTPENKLKNLLPAKLSLKTTLPTTILAVFFFLLFAIPYIEVKDLYNLDRSWGEIASHLPKIQSYFFSARSNLWISPDLEIFKQVSFLHEQQLFVGIGSIMALSILYLKNNLLNSNPLARKMHYSASLMIIFTIMIGGLTLYQIFTLIPGISSVRVVARIILVLIFPIGYLVGYTIDRIKISGFSSINSTPIIFLICSLIIFEPIFAKKLITSDREWKNRVAKLESQIDKSFGKDTILVVKSTFDTDEIDAMHLAQKLGVKTINGYSGNSPGGLTYLNDCDKVQKRISAIEKEKSRIEQRNYKLDTSNFIYVGFEKDCNS